ncbi:MAG: VWA domain-containing protein [Clostridium sp.]|nr:VWA domain-containing protein [Clostridium sp.]MCM1171743.1 VWA domain-containing protein [Clostridium sp.]MCM1209843.1 VWA domain-containing protein [Ruminococcus sp.]
MNNDGKKIVFCGVIVVMLMAGIIMALLTKNISDKKERDDRPVDELLEDISVTEATPKKGTISLEDDTLYDELPSIDKYPLAVQGYGDIDIEIFTSGEKAGQDTDNFLIEAAEKFNAGGYTLESGETISISVRSVSSGLAADYIRSGRYYPDLYTPSNELFGDFAKAGGAKLDMLADRLVGNTAGILVKKDSGYTDVNSVINDVKTGKLNLGYTNPQTSATGLNLLIEILKTSDESNMFSDTAIEAFSTFNGNIPYIAYTTQQMRDSAGKGNFDAIVSEYQAYINDKNLVSQYDFIPFGARHDNPLYIVNKNNKSPQEIAAMDIVKDYLLSSDVQAIATRNGFNANDDYQDDYTTSGSEIVQALEVYKRHKDSGNDIIAVFVADCSGSMDGEPMQQLKYSLSNGAKYINDNNYIGMVSYSSDVTIELPIAPFDFNQRSYFQGAIDGLRASGSTYTYEALVVAIDMVQKKHEENPDAKCMIILLSDGYANGELHLDNIKGTIANAKIPIYTIGYGNDADTNELQNVSGINEAASINADSEDIIYKIKSLFNSQL